MTPALPEGAPAWRAIGCAAKMTAELSHPHPKSVSGEGGFSQLEMGGQKPYHERIQTRNSGDGRIWGDARGLTQLQQSNRDQGLKAQEPLKIIPGIELTVFDAAASFQTHCDSP